MSVAFFSDQVAHVEATGRDRPTEANPETETPRSAQLVVLRPNSVGSPHTTTAAARITSQKRLARPTKMVASTTASRDLNVRFPQDAGTVP